MRPIGPCAWGTRGTMFSRWSWKSTADLSKPLLPARVSTHEQSDTRGSSLTRLCEWYLIDFLTRIGALLVLNNSCVDGCIARRASKGEGTATPASRTKRLCASLLRYQADAIELPIMEIVLVEPIQSPGMSRLHFGSSQDLKTCCVCFKDGPALHCIQARLICGQSTSCRNADVTASGTRSIRQENSFNDYTKGPYLRTDSGTTRTLGVMLIACAADKVFKTVHRLLLPTSTMGAVSFLIGEVQHASNQDLGRQNVIFGSFDQLFFISQVHKGERSSLGISMLLPVHTHRYR
jgi:hypothetical protein